METVLPWVFAAVSLGVAVLAIVHARSQAARMRALELEGQTKAQTAKAAEKRFEEKVRETRKRGEELAELRKRLEKAKKRASRVQDEHQGDGARVAQLEEELRIARADRREALAELDRVTSAKLPKPTPPIAVAPPIQAADPTPDQMAALKALAERAERAEGQATALEAELRTAAREAARYCKKARSLETAYTAQHGELAAKRDRLRALQEEVERLGALRAGLAASGSPALVEPPPAMHEGEAPAAIDAMDATEEGLPDSRSA